MQHPISHRASSAVVVAIIVALSACDDHAVNPNEPSPSLRRDHEALAQFDSITPSTGIDQVTLSSKTLTIGGSIGYTASIFSTSKSYTGLSVRGSIVQHQVRFPVVDQAAPCAFGSPICTFTGTISATAASLVPGSALFELQLVNAFGAILQTVDVGMTLVAAQTITSVRLGATALTIGGPLTLFTATLQNTGPSISGVAIQGWLIQASTNARRATGGSAVQCGSGVGILPTGACTMPSIITTSNSTAATGTLSPGAATFELDLTINGTVVAQRTVPVSLASAAKITGLTLSSTRADTVLIEGAAVAYTATLQNGGSLLSGISIQGSVVQGDTRRFAGGTALGCSNTAGVLPNSTCTVSSQLTATNNTAGTGTLVSGAAMFELTLVDANGVVLSASSIPLTLIEGPLTSPPPGPGGEANRLTIPSLRYHR
jgi:hypothetical protein